MKNISPKVFSLLSVLVLAGSFSFASAQTSSTEVKTNSKVEISIPVEKEDFLLFYGITDNIQTNIELTELRKDFAEKFNNLKDEYKKSFNNIVDGVELKPGVAEEIKEEVKPVALQASAKVMTNNSKAASENIKTVKEVSSNVSGTVKKYIIEDTKNVIITPIVNMINDKAAIKTETSSWFQKIKSWFGW